MAKYYPKKSHSIDSYDIEEHPFDPFLPTGLHTLIVGTFPTHHRNLKFDFYYSSSENNFWTIMEKIFSKRFIHFQETEAKFERADFMKKNGIGLIDMLSKCYRKNGSSSDHNLYPILLTDIFQLLDKNPTVSKILFTSRSGIFSALGLFKTYLLQKGKDFIEPRKNDLNVLVGNFTHNNRSIKILVPYSPSPTLISEGRTTLEELIKMYKFCLND